ncbi:hypothetical protein [Rhizobium sp. L51/94]|uniref:hypothetical protein n=1 Tax=Rhizobium sp. L51/94 TaxID=2819999 RepID=UPI001C5B0D4B|nr:hypothetical protein [Rhizobium sp. L51/94]QXZ79667.1 hypothetical protein J5274_06705 [Rhizobium sp. L51/94]
MQYERFIGSFGGEGPIYYTAISAYARDHGIVGDDLKLFHIFINAVDAEYLAISAEDAKRRADAEKKTGGR